MSRAELKANTVNDPKFWFGIIGMIVTTGLYMWFTARQFGHLEEKLNNLDGIRDRVIQLESNRDAQDARIKALEQYSHVGPNPTWRKDN